MVLILSWCVDEPHSQPQENSTRLCGFNYPERPSCPSNTADLPAGSLLPSIPNKPENRRPSDPIRQKIKKISPHFPVGLNQKKGWSAGERRSNQKKQQEKEQNGSHHQSNKKRLTGNSRQPFKLNHFKIVSCLYSISSSAVLFPLYTKMLSILSPFFPVWYLM